MLEDRYSSVLKEVKQEPNNMSGLVAWDRDARRQFQTVPEADP